MGVSTLISTMPVTEDFQKISAWKTYINNSQDNPTVESMCMIKICTHKILCIHLSDMQGENGQRRLQQIFGHMPNKQLIKSICPQLHLRMGFPNLKHFPSSYYTKAQTCLTFQLYSCFVSSYRPFNLPYQISTSCTEHLDGITITVISFLNGKFI